jgi:hypothetical protein
VVTLCGIIEIYGYGLPLIRVGIVSVPRGSCVEIMRAVRQVGWLAARERDHASKLL